MMSKEGLSLIELLVVIVLVAIGLLAIAVPFVEWSVARSHWSPFECMAKLNEIGEAMKMYVADFDGRFPLLMSQGDPNAPVSRGTVSNNLWDTRLGSNAMQNMWILISQDFVDQDIFHCPQDRAWTERTAPEKYGWTCDTEFSYGLQWPYRKDNSGGENPAALTEELDGSVVIMADKCPAGGTISKSIPPSNHPKHGVNFLRASGTVKFHKSHTDANAGAEGDDIYLNADGVKGGLPKHELDSVLVP